MRYLLDGSPETDQQANTVAAIQSEAIPKQLYPPIWYRVRVPNLGVPFEFSYIWEDGTLVEIPTFIHVVLLSPEFDQVLCSYYRNSVGEHYVPPHCTTPLAREINYGA